MQRIILNNRQGDRTKLWLEEMRRMLKEGVFDNVVVHIVTKRGCEQFDNDPVGISNFLNKIGTTRYGLSIYKVPITIGEAAEDYKAFEKN